MCRVCLRHEQKYGRRIWRLLQECRILHFLVDPRLNVATLPAPNAFFFAPPRAPTPTPGLYPFRLDRRENRHELGKAKKIISY